MPIRREDSEDSEDLLPKLFETVVEIATKSAESSTTAAKAIQHLETALLSAKASSEASKSASEDVRNEIRLLVVRVEALERQREGEPSLIKAFGDALKDPRTLLIILTFLASLFGSRLIPPFNVAGIPPVVLPAAGVEK